MAFVGQESIEDTNHASLGSLTFLGVSTAAGAAVATAAIFGGALLAGAAGAAAVGAVGAVVGRVIAKSDAYRLAEQVDEGHLLLFVRTKDADSEQVALQILSRNGAIEPKVYCVPTAERET
jgi:outer membrane lipoprotein SlyB